MIDATQTRKDETMNKTAIKRYAARRDEINRLIGALWAELDDHEARVSMAPSQWGMVGDLDQVRNDLINAIVLINGVGMQREDIERFLAETE